MKKYILPLMSIAMMMAMASCSSSDDAVAENNVEGKLVQMTFTATQESNVDTRSALGTGNSVVWKSGDKISVFDGSGIENNHKFTLDGDGGYTSGSFTGTAASNPNTPGNYYYAVYPYTEGACLDEDIHYAIIKDITLPSTQTAIKDSFDPKAALMIAKSSDKNQIDFNNVVSLVKIKTEFDCKRIVLNANEYIAGKGKLYAKNNPDIEFTSDQSKSIVLKPATEGGDIEAGTYYIAVKPGTLTAGWSISFTSTDYNVYTRKANNGVTFNRSKIRSIGSFNTESTLWTSTSRGDKVSAGQEVDLGLTITKEDGKKYRVIFANANLTTTGLAENESDFGDYFAWGATEPWYDNISFDGTSPTVTWKTNYTSGGYSESNYNTYSNGKTIEVNGQLAIEYDAARKILHGEWQIPSNAVWQVLINNSTNKGWNDDKKGYCFINNGNTLFLPAAGYFTSSTLGHVGTKVLCRSCTAHSSTDANMLYYGSDHGLGLGNDNRCRGVTIRPVRLVEVNN